MVEIQLLVEPRLILMFGSSRVRRVERRGGAGRGQDRGWSCNKLPKVSLRLLSDPSTLRPNGAAPL